MLLRIDRIQMAVPDHTAAARNWVGLLGAEPERNDYVRALGARCWSYRLGNGRIELLEPDGAGAVADALTRRGGGHLFAAGASTPDVDAVVARLRTFGVEPHVERGQAYLEPQHTGGAGLRLVVSEEREEAAVGAIDEFYEVTDLVADAPAAVARIAELFDLDASAFCPIASKVFGYDGALTLFHPDRLHRFEVITPFDLQKTMGRFFAKMGSSLYMAFAESNDLAAIEAAASAERLEFTAVREPGAADGEEPHTIFLHPSTLGGMMLGVSRRNYAWTWSGRPDRRT